MPELPEVESIKRDLNKVLIGKKLISTNIKNSEFLFKNKIDSLDSLLETKLLEINRYGKYLIFLFEKEGLLFHLGLTGFFLFTLPSAYQKYHILSLNFQNLTLNYFDIRKLGKIRKINKNNWKTIKEFKNLGKDACEIIEEEFRGLIKNCKKVIKSFLLDQKILAGLGNIYADELLYRAKINPFKETKTLTEEEIKRLFYEMKKLLKEAIDLKGSSVKNFVNINGDKGKFQEKHMVYGRKGKNCLKCGTVLVYKKINQRGTTFCPVCQPL